MKNLLNDPGIDSALSTGDSTINGTVDLVAVVGFLDLLLKVRYAWHRMICKFWSQHSTTYLKF